MTGQFRQFNLSADQISRFNARIVKGDQSGCWLWLGTVQKGYASFSINDESYQASRVAWFLAHGEHARGFVCHTCDNPLRVNPGHLWIGSNADNQADSSLKGRQRGQSQTHCKHGHAFDEANTYWRKGKVAARCCRVCTREAQARYKARRAA